MPKNVKTDSRVLAWAAILGFFVYCSELTSPIHELFHVITAILEGLEFEMHWSHAYIYGNSVLVAYAGIYGEASFFLWLAIKLAKKKYFGWAYMAWGHTLGVFSAIVICLLANIEIADVTYGLKASEYSIVFLYLWVILCPIGLIISFYYLKHLTKKHICDS